MLERRREEPHLIADRVRPVVPRMAAWPLRIVVRHAERDEPFVQCAVRADEGIVAAAIDRQVEMRAHE